MFRTTGRSKLLWVTCVLSAGSSLAGCGDHGGSRKAEQRGRVSATPAPDPARAAKINGYGPDGKPIDAVSAAEMSASSLPPLPEVDYAKQFAPAPKPPPFNQAEASAGAPAPK